MSWMLLLTSPSASSSAYVTDNGCNITNRFNQSITSAALHRRRHSMGETGAIKNLWGRRSQVGSLAPTSFWSPPVPSRSTEFFLLWHHLQVKQFLKTYRLCTQPKCTIKIAKVSLWKWQKMHQKRLAAGPGLDLLGSIQHSLRPCSWI